jgi:hypothetical protein
MSGRDDTTDLAVLRTLANLGSVLTLPNPTIHVVSDPDRARPGVGA